MLVATDALTKVIDAPYITIVINYDMPKDLQKYMNRCGRLDVMRGSREHYVINLVSP